MTGFTYRAGLAEDGPTYQPFVVSATVAIGDMVKIDVSNGQVAPATTNADGLVVGVVLGPADFTTKMDALVNGTSKVNVITDPDCVYAIADPNARKAGQRLDISGGTGAQALAAPTNNDFIVYADSTAQQETLVRIASKQHYTNP